MCLCRCCRFSGRNGRQEDDFLGRGLLDHEFDRMEIIQKAEDYLGKLAFGSYFNGHMCMLRALCEAAAVR